MPIYNLNLDFITQVITPTNLKKKKKMSIINSLEIYTLPSLMLNCTKWFLLLNHHFIHSGRFLPNLCQDDDMRRTLKVSGHCQFTASLYSGQLFSSGNQTRRNLCSFAPPNLAHPIQNNVQLRYSKFPQYKKDK